MREVERHFCGDGWLRGRRGRACGRIGGEGLRFRECWFKRLKYSSNFFSVRDLYAKEAVPRPEAFRELEHRLRLRQRTRAESVKFPIAAGVQYLAHQRATIHQAQKVLHTHEKGIRNRRRGCLDRCTIIFRNLASFPHFNRTSTSPRNLAPSSDFLLQRCGFKVL